MGHVEYCIDLKTKKSTGALTVASKKSSLSPAELLQYEALIDQLGNQINYLEKNIVRFQDLLKGRKLKNGNFKIILNQREIKISNREITSDRLKECKRLKGELETKLSNAITKTRIYR